MRNNSMFFRQKLLFSAMAAVFVTGAYAQQAPQTAPQDTSLEEIQVTGSRIRNVTSMTTPTPVTAVTQTELQAINPAATAAEQLDALPQFFNTQTAQRGGGTFGNASGSFLNLRGMGAQRTLVLLDGSRVIPADASGNVNIDNFPQALTKRIDVITGGASAAYGADAVAGVVNFVLDREFEGLKTRISTGITERLDGENWNFSVAGGASLMDNRLHLIGSVESRHIDQINGDRDRLDNWQDWGLVQNPAWKASDPAGTNPRRITVPYVFDNRTSPQGLITNALVVSPTGTGNAGGGTLNTVPASNTFGLRNYTFTDDGKGVRPYGFGQYSNAFTASQSGGQEYKTNTEAFAFGPDGNEVVQRSFFGGAKYDISDTFSVHGQAIMGRTESNTYGNRSQMTIAGLNYDYILYRDNPYLPQTVRDEMIRANVDAITVGKRGQVRSPGLVNGYDNRGDRNVSQLESATVGFEWDLNDNWHMTGNYQRGKSKVQTGTLNQPRIDQYYLAVDAVKNALGQTVCNISTANPTAEQLKAFMAGKTLPSPLSLLGVPADSPVGPVTPADCRPLNVLGLGNSSQDAVAYVESAQKKSVREMDQDFAEVLLSGEIYEGWGAGPVSLATGLTWRDEELVQYTLPAYGERGVLNAPGLGIRGIPTGFAGLGNRTLHSFTGPSVGVGANSIKEIFGELNIPVWEWSTGQSITSTVAGRRSDYESSGGVNSWKLGFDVTLYEDLRWRITKSRDVREPNLAERFMTAPGGGAVLDPFRNGQNNNTLTILGAPNADLTLEQADTITTGIIYTPSFAEWADGIQVALDWYEIDVDQSIALYGGQRMVDDCYASTQKGAPDPYTCGRIFRAAPSPVTPGGVPSPGLIERILNLQTNSAGAQTRGVDLELQYRTEPNLFAGQDESLSVRGIVGFLDERSNTSATGTVVEFAGRISTPEFTGLLTFNYDVGDYGIMLQSNYYDSTQSNGNNEAINVNWIEGVDVDDNTIASQTIFNLGLNYGREMESGGDWQVSFNVNNLFDRDPPIIAGTGGQVLSNSHDQFGRRYQVSLNMSF
jgi:iron complex outermembrane recepter protein